jgi:hypothetical protein
MKSNSFFRLRVCNRQETIHEGKVHDYEPEWRCKPCFQDNVAVFTENQIDFERRFVGEGNCD